jgi:hypothetical protein
MRSTRFYLALLLLALAAGGIAYWRLARRGPSAAPVLTVYFTCDTIGRLEPCGCFTGQHGGLTRLRTWLETNPPPGESLKLDVGGAIAGQHDYDLIQYRYLARAYQSMGYAALNLGGREAMVPAADLTTLAGASPVPLISASVVDAATRQPLLPAYRIVEAGGKRIGILGVVSPRSVPAPGDGLAVLALNEAVDRHLPALAAQTDLVILLAFADENELRRLARDYFEFALILGGDVPGPTQDIIRENDSLIVFTTNQARTIGSLTARLGAGKRTKLLEPEYDIQLLWDHIPQHAELRAMVREYRTEIRHTRLAVDDPNTVDPDAIPGVATAARYVGSAACRECHPQAFQTWEKSPHARAFKSLVGPAADADPHCVGCHTIGFGKPGGYLRAYTDTKLTDVGCESCHGPASEHLDRYLHHRPNHFKFRPLGAGDCIACHYGEFSRPFDWQTFWPPMAHGREGEGQPPR